MSRRYEADMYENETAPPRLGRKCEVLGVSIIGIRAKRDRGLNDFKRAKTD